MSDQQDLSQHEIEEIEHTRETRLDPDNRPENAEVDNSDRKFDADRGHFTDAEEYDDGEPPKFSDAEDPNNPDSEANQANQEWTASQEED
jgi:hypothetical protein